MDNAWDLKDQGGSGGISIPTDDFQGGTNGASGDAPRRSRSRSPGRGRRGGGEEEAENPGNNLHVSGLHYKVDTRELESIFVKVGRVQKASVVTDPHTRESRLFGFVTMESREEADAAITALNGTELMGKVITVTRARRGRARTPTPGKYHGPGKRRGDRERPYEPRPYDGRYDGRSADYDDRRRGGGRYDDRDRDRDRDRRPSRRDDRDRDYGRGDRYERYDRYDDRDRERDRDSRDRRY